MVHVAIPGGVWRGDVLCAAGLQREFPLRPVAGEDEAFLLDTVDSAVPSERANALLTRCLGDENAEELARSLTIGDREALLLHLRRLTLGDVIDCVLLCPIVDCGERIQMELRTSDLLVPEYDDVRREYSIAVEEEGIESCVDFRLPTSVDLDLAAGIAVRDPERGAKAMFERCVLRARRGDSPLTIDAFSPALRDSVIRAMADRDPQAEIELAVRCPACASAFSVIFDTATFFLQELDARAAHLMREVHTLAWYYHWSEREIVKMSRHRRAQYLELIAEAVVRARPR